MFHVKDHHRYASDLLTYHLHVFLSSSLAILWCCSCSPGAFQHPSIAFKECHVFLQVCFMDSEDNEPSAIGTPERHEPPPRMPRHSSDDDAFSFREPPRLATVPEGGPLGSAPQQQVSGHLEYNFRPMTEVLLLRPNEALRPRCHALESVWCSSVNMRGSIVTQRLHKMDALSYRRAGSAC